MLMMLADARLVGPFRPSKGQLMLMMLALSGQARGQLMLLMLALSAPFRPSTGQLMLMMLALSARSGPARAS